MAQRNPTLFAASDRGPCIYALLLLGARDVEPEGRRQVGCLEGRPYQVEKWAFIGAFQGLLALDQSPFSLASLFSAVADHVDLSAMRRA